MPPFAWLIVPLNRSTNTRELGEVLRERLHTTAARVQLAGQNREPLLDFPLSRIGRIRL